MGGVAITRHVACTNLACGTNNNGSALQNSWRLSSFFRSRVTPKIVFFVEFTHGSTTWRIGWVKLDVKGGFVVGGCSSDVTFGAFSISRSASTTSTLCGFGAFPPRLSTVSFQYGLWLVAPFNDVYFSYNLQYDLYTYYCRNMREASADACGHAEPVQECMWSITPELQRNLSQTRH